VGNDIVDLRAPGACGKACDARFVQRVLTVEERHELLRSESPDTLLWAFWAAKETAYKAVSKIYPDLSSAPGRFYVMFDSPKPGGLSGHMDGRVKTPGATARIRVFFHENHVHCIGTTAARNGLNEISWGVRAISPGGKNKHPHVCESAFVRKFAKERIARHTGRHGNDIRIQRDNMAQGLGPPIVYFNGKKADLDISLSHDNRFVAFAFFATGSIFTTPSIVTDS